MENSNGTISEISAAAARRNLALLVRLRWLAIAGQIGAITVTYYALGVDLPRREMAPVVAFLVLLNLFSSWRLRTRRPVSDLTVTAELLLDVAALTMLLFLSGGASNPFVTLFILQVILGIVLLPAGNALIVLAATIAAHYWLLGNGLALVLPSSGHSGHGGHAAGPSFFDLHLQGMFLSFALAACLLAWFVLRIMQNLRERDRQIEALRRQMLEEDHLVRLGLLASGAAHELGTPMTTLAVTLDDWSVLGPPRGEAGKAELARMLEELSRCRRIVSDMLLSSGQERLDEVHPEDAGAFVEALVLQWTKEGGTLAASVKDECGGATIAADPMLAQALRQILDNAQEAGAATIRVSVTAERDHVTMELTDDGPGFPPELLAARERGSPAVSSVTGRGLGLLLVATALRRLSGGLRLSNSDRSGASVTLTLPRAGRPS